MFICYATPEKIDYYPPFNPKNPLHYLRKRLLILGKEWVLTQRRRYPPLPPKQLKQAIAQEIGDLFPLKEPSFTFQVLRRGETFVEVNLFAWEKTIEEELKKNFPFSHLIPEELFYRAQDPTLFILKRHQSFLFIASAHFLFLNSLFLKEEPTREEINLFLKSLGELSPKRVIVLGVPEDILKKFLPETLRPYLIHKKEPSSLFPEILSHLTLKEYKVKRALHFEFSRFLLFSARVFLMLVIALTANLFFSYTEYTKAINELKKKNKLFDSEIKKLLFPLSAKKATEKAPDEERLKALEELKSELKELEKKGVSHPLFYLNELAKVLPDGSRLERFSVREKSLEIFLEAKDIFEVLSLLRKNPYFSELKLSGSPSFDSRRNIYRFRLEVHLK